MLKAKKMVSKAGTPMSPYRWKLLKKAAEAKMKNDCHYAGRNVYGSDYGKCRDQIAWELSEIPDFNPKHFIEDMWEQYEFELGLHDDPWDKN